MTNPPIPTADLDAVRRSVLDRMERHEQNMHLAIIGAFVLEAVLGAVAFRLVDWQDRTQTIIVIMSVLTYTVIVLGLVALGAHISRVVGRVLLAIQPGPVE